MLDAGCGPGSITLGFAELLSPGVITGIDIDASQVAKAGAEAQARGIGNIRFMQADLQALPFEDESFDAVFGHTVFMHLAHPEKVLSELFRVCKPGGWIAIREGLGMLDCLMTVPVHGTERPFSDWMKEISRLGDGDPDIGLRLKGFLYAAGFRKITPSCHSEIYHDPVGLLMLQGWFASILKGSAGEKALASGLITPASLDEMLAKMRRWPADPAAVAVVSWIEYLAWKP